MAEHDDEINAKLEKLLKKIFQVDKISLDYSMDDIPEWDSFKHIELIIGLEQEFNIKLEYTDTTDMTSIPIIKSKVLKLLNDK
jgi:acyl carrier protein|tara:strand:- start:646 stop:894 length:249 start_codon:yes stop_codon:yes gene_type:complete